MWVEVQQDLPIYLQINKKEVGLGIKIRNPVLVRPIWGLSCNVTNTRFTHQNKEGAVGGTITKFRSKQLGRTITEEQGASGEQLREG